MDHGFAHLGAERISGEVFVGNVPSRRILEKLDFRLEATLRRSVEKRGAWLDAWIFGCTRDDWRAGRGAVSPGG